MREPRETRSDINPHRHATGQFTSATFPIGNNTGWQKMCDVVSQSSLHSISLKDFSGRAAEIGAAFLHPRHCHCAQ